MENKDFDVVIVGGGITGTALSFILSKYSDVGSVLLLEKYDELSTLNTSAKANSQTLHCGDIETNYTLKKAISVKRTANMIVRYAEQLDKNDFLQVYPKMILAVGDDECSALELRYEEFKEAFPYMELWDAKKIAEVEPKVALKNGKPRDEKILASGCLDEYSAVDYGKLSHSFIENAKQYNKVEVSLANEVKSITKLDNNSYELKTKEQQFTAKFVVVCAGAHSLLIANNMGFGMDISILPMAGSFYFIPPMLNGKVYTMQNDKLPFAALHGDPDIIHPDKTRLGPTALAMPKLERYTGGTYWDFWKSLKLDKSVVTVMWDLLKDSTIRNYIFRNFLFEIPFINRKLFAKDARKIIPDLHYTDLTYAKGYGGIRGQAINKTEKILQLGEASIIPDDENLIFNMTPSPGATTCLGNGYRDAKIVCKALGIKLDEATLKADLLDGQDL